MCGIVGAVAHRRVSKILLEGLKRLEYRGYDSAGIAMFEAQEIVRIRQAGKVEALAKAMAKHTLKGSLGIAHTRWATHGEANEANAHPHMSGQKLALVHNGIIDNYQAVKQRLKHKGYEFRTQTDSEAIAHLIDDHYQEINNLFGAVKRAVAELEGAYAIAVIHQDHPDQLICTRQGAPLVIGVGFDEHFVASDQLALSQVTNRFIYLEEQDLAIVRAETLEIFDKQTAPVERDVHTFEVTSDAADKGPFKHYMLKEIFEQTSVAQRCLEGRIHNHRVLESLFGHQSRDLLKTIKAVQIVACGTSYHAGLVAKHWIEELANIPCQVDVASEYRYRKTVTLADSLFITLSQSGETADTLAALRKAKKEGFSASLTICNVPGSSLVRESDISVMMNAGPEIGVASTKAFIAQLICLMLLTLVLARRLDTTQAKEIEIVKGLVALPDHIQTLLDQAELIEMHAQAFIEKQHALFLGRGSAYPIAMEGALKLKEISYIHAEAYPAGELKHGPLALVDKDMPIIAVAPNDNLLDKLKSNLEVVSARGGEIFLFADKNAKMPSQDSITIIEMETLPKYLEPMLMVIPLQLLSYYVAVLKGTDIDQPRNLAKSVTVE
jgi:glucosamine--fructose-6-phosphate aminotransferase (isomerizing)